MWLGIILGAMLLGLAALIRKFDVTPAAHMTVLAAADKPPSAAACCST